MKFPRPIATYKLLTPFPVLFYLFNCQTNISFKYFTKRDVWERNISSWLIFLWYLNHNTCRLAYLSVQVRGGGGRRKGRQSKLSKHLLFFCIFFLSMRPLFTGPSLSYWYTFSNSVPVTFVSVYSLHFCKSDIFLSQTGVKHSFCWASQGRLDVVTMRANLSCVQEGGNVTTWRNISKSSKARYEAECAGQNKQWTLEKLRNCRSVNCGRHEFRKFCKNTWISCCSI